MESPLLLLSFEPKSIKEMSHLQNYRSVRKVLPGNLAIKIGFVESLPPAGCDVRSQSLTYFRNILMFPVVACTNTSSSEPVCFLPTVHIFPCVN